MKARVTHLHKTEAEWKKLNNWVPEVGEFIIYDPDKNYDYARIKVGDGRALKDLPFFIDSVILAKLSEQHYGETIDGGIIS